MTKKLFVIIFCLTLSFEVHSLSLKKLTDQLNQVAEDLNKSADTEQNLDSGSVSNIQNSSTAPAGTEKISQEDIVQVDLDSYPISPSDKALDQLNFNMNKDQAVAVLKNNGCKIEANWKRRVITKGQKLNTMASFETSRCRMVEVPYNLS